MLGEAVIKWHLLPAVTDGYRNAKVTINDVDKADLCSSTMQSKRVPGPYFVSEAVDITGHLGGYNFQSAWSSGFAAR